MGEKNQPRKRVYSGGDEDTHHPAHGRNAAKEAAETGSASEQQQIRRRKWCKEKVKGSDRAVKQPVASSSFRSIKNLITVT